MYKNYVFDVYGTLVDIYTNEYDSGVWQVLAEFLEFYGVRYSPEELMETYFRFCDEEMRSHTDEYAFPEIDVVDVFRRIFSEKGAKANKSLATHTAQLFRALATKYIRLYDGVKEMLESLKRRHKKLYILSNAQKCFTYQELNGLGIKKYFNGIVYSSEAKCLKPDTALFDLLLSKYKLNKADTVLIGNDAETDIAGASNAGIDSLYIKSNLSKYSDKASAATYAVNSGNVAEITEILR